MKTLYGLGALGLAIGIMFGSSQLAEANQTQLPTEFYDKDGCKYTFSGSYNHDRQPLYYKNCSSNHTVYNSSNLGIDNYGSYGNYNDDNWVYYPAVNHSNLSYFWFNNAGGHYQYHYPLHRVRYHHKIHHRNHSNFIPHRPHVNFHIPHRPHVNFHNPYRPSVHHQIRWNGGGHGFPRIRVNNRHH